MINIDKRRCFKEDLRRQPHRIDSAAGQRKYDHPWSDRFTLIVERNINVGSNENITVLTKKISHFCDGQQQPFISKANGQDRHDRST